MPFPDLVSSFCPKKVNTTVVVVTQAQQIVLDHPDEQTEGSAEGHGATAHFLWSLSLPRKRDLAANLLLILAFWGIWIDVTEYSCGRILSNSNQEEKGERDKDVVKTEQTNFCLRTLYSHRNNAHLIEDTSNKVTHIKGLVHSRHVLHRSNILLNNDLKPQFQRTNSQSKCFPSEIRKSKTYTAKIHYSSTECVLTKSERKGEEKRREVGNNRDEQGIASRWMIENNEIPVAPWLCSFPKILLTLQPVGEPVTFLFSRLLAAVSYKADWMLSKGLGIWISWKITVLILDLSQPCPVHADEAASTQDCEAS